jgi:hypothetical protein
MPNYYIYVLFRKTGLPFYIGKGYGNRWGAHERAARNNKSLNNPRKLRIIRQMFAEGWSEIPKIKLAKDLTPEQACVYEKAWIKALGRIGREPNGLLVNLTDGGDGMSGWVMSTYHREALSARRRNKPLSEAQRKVITAMIEGNRGKRLSAARRAALMASTRDKPRSEAQLAALAAGRRSVTGKTQTEAHRQKRSAALSGKPKSESHRQKLAAAKRGKPLLEAHRTAIASGLRGKAKSEAHRQAAAIARWPRS